MLGLRTLLIASTVLLGACGGGPDPTSREALEAGDFLTADGTGITLSEGAATDASGVVHELMTSAEGDLDFDGEMDAAAVTIETQGSARLIRLHAFLGDGRTVSDVSARLLGDRIGVRRVSIDEGVIRVDLVLRRPSEPVTIQPTVPFAQHFVLTDRGITSIVETRVDDDDRPVRMQEDSMSEEAEIGSAPVLFTHEWILDAFEMADWTGDLSSLEEPVALRFVAELADVAGASGQFTGFAGCNRIFGSFRAEESEILRIAGLASTRKMCAGPLADLEQRFLSAFASVEAFEVRGDALTLRFVGGQLRFKAGGRLVPVEPEVTSLEEDDDPPHPNGEPESRRQT